MASSRKRSRWTEVKARLDAFDRRGLLGLVGDLYEASASTRRFLHARLLPSDAEIEEYQQLVSEAVFPDPLSRRPIRLRDGSAAITEYRRSTGDLAGTVRLMLTFVEAGTEQAADLGYGNESYFAALENKVDGVVGLLEALPPDVRAAATARLVAIRDRGKNIGWGYGDYLAEVVAPLQRRRLPARAPRNQLRSLTRG